MFECRIKAEEYPEEGEIVIAKTVSTDDNVLNMKLVEYGGIPGLVLSSEVSKRRIRSMHQITKVGNTEICQVLKVDRAKGHIDLSLKSVGDKERKECIENGTKNKLAYQIMLKASKLVHVPVELLYEKFGYAKSREYGFLHSYFVRAKEDAGVLSDNQYGDQLSRVIEEQFKPSSYKVRVDIDVTSPVHGVESIKAAFRKALDECPDLDIVLLRTPTYSITKVCDNKERAFQIVNRASETVREYIEGQRGTFAIACSAKVYGEKFRHMLLEDTKDAKAPSQDGSDDSDDSS